MIRMRPGIAIAAIALLAACESGEPEQDVRDINVAGGDYPQRIGTMPEGERNAVFIRAIRDAGRDCQHVQTSARQPDRNGQPVWTATCDDGGNWVIVIGEDGIAQVASFAELEAAAGAGNSSLP